MRIAYPPEPVVHLDGLYRLSPDGGEELLCSGRTGLTFWGRQERRDYVIYEGHMYYPWPEYRFDLWEAVSA